MMTKIHLMSVALRFGQVAFVIRVATESFYQSKAGLKVRNHS